jgi:hypothetical protein
MTMETQIIPTPQPLDILFEFPDIMDGENEGCPDPRKS